MAPAHGIRNCAFDFPATTGGSARSARGKAGSARARRLHSARGMNTHSLRVLPLVVVLSAVLPGFARASGAELTQAPSASQVRLLADDTAQPVAPATAQ